jgi:three-Cys-motif partner protein
MKDPEYYRGREQTYLKHFFLERYLERVAYNVGSFASNFVYIDGFAGPWRTDDPAFEDTSPIIAASALKAVRQGLQKSGRSLRIRCVFVEADVRAFARLRELAEQVRDLEVLTINSTFEEAIPKVMDFLADSFSLTFIDPTGWMGYRLDLITPLLRRRLGEVIVNFMYDHMNRFQESFDYVLGNTDWRSTLDEGEGREAARLALFCEGLKRAGGFEYVTSTRIKKPLADRSYFHLVYGTRHPKGLLEYRRVEESEIREQERIRLDARQLDRMIKTGQTELFPLSDLVGEMAPSFEDERRRNLGLAHRRVSELLPISGTISYKDVWPSVLSIPLVWESDVERIVRAQANVIGLKPRERRLKPDHLLSRK